MKYLVIFVILLGVGINPTSKNKLKLDKNYKVEETFSGNTSNQKTFHLIVAKNKETKLFEIIPLTYINQEISKLSSISFQDKPKILSYHNNKSVLSLITSVEEDKEKVINIHDLNLETGIITKSKNYNSKDYKSVIQQKNASLLLFANNENFKVLNVSNTQELKETVVNKTVKNKDLFKILNKEKIDAINTNEFVANGSIGVLRAYSSNSILYITQEDENENTTNVSTIDISNEGTVSIETKTFKSNTKLKKSTSYISDNELFKLSLDKKSGNINIFDLEDDSNKSLNLNSLKPIKESSGFHNMESFLKRANKSANAPTITVNKTNKGAIVLRADYVNKDSYYYDHFWFHHWFHMQMMHNLQHQNTINSAPRFGPSIPSFEEGIYFVKDERHYFEIVLDKNKEISQEKVETVFKDYNKRKHLNKLKENKLLDHISATFLDNELRYIAYNKKSKMFGVVEKTVSK